MARKTIQPPPEIPIVDDLEKCEKEVIDALLNIPHGGSCRLLINSGGGSVYAGLGIATTLEMRQIKATAGRFGGLLFFGPASFFLMPGTPDRASRFVSFPPNAVVERRTLSLAWRDGMGQGVQTHRRSLRPMGLRSNGTESE